MDPKVRMISKTPNLCKKIINILSNECQLLIYESYRHVNFGAVCPQALCVGLLIIINSIDKSRNPPEWFVAFPSALYLHLDVHIF